MERERLARILNQRSRKVIKDDSKVTSAVLIPLYIKEGQPHVLLTKRSIKVNTHKGQISLPGGVYSREVDDDLQQTALRETFEEVGIKTEDIDVIGPLDDLVTITGFQITPYVGFIPYPYSFNINKDEIDEIIEVPLHLIFGKEDTRQIKLRDEPYMHYAYLCNGRYIWGATARILKQFFDLVL